MIPANASSTAVVSAMLDLSQASQRTARSKEGASDKLRENLKATIDYINEHILTNVDNVRPGKGAGAEDRRREAYQGISGCGCTARTRRSDSDRTLSERPGAVGDRLKAELNALEDREPDHRRLYRR